MRIKIEMISEKPAFIPLNYQYRLHSAIYALIAKSSETYARFLHDVGFQSALNTLKTLKLFTFSRLFVYPYHFRKDGLYDVRRLELIVATAVEKSYEHLIYGIFAERELRLGTGRSEARFQISRVESLAEPEFRETMKFICLSPITVSTVRDREDRESPEPHFLEYLKPEEKEPFIRNLQKNLIRKYETVHKRNYITRHPFEFAFDAEYLLRRQGRISKLIRFKNGIVIKAFEAPFSITADPELIKVGYQCGFGEKNSAGFGCVEIADAE
ncbi:MAG TPA: CRISPR-associated endoribonuclease Cas6 [Candidatus Marinimicrobia bacterium]|nr:CRISPR-associated endoribonuclease Cas6 [Candidatus Neomarinimicrobiota bacterium]